MEILNLKVPGVPYLRKGSKLLFTTAAVAAFLHANTTSLPPYDSYATLTSLPVPFRSEPDFTLVAN